MNKQIKITLAMASMICMIMCANANAQTECGYEVQLIQAPACPPFGPRPTNGFGISEEGNIVGSYLDCANGYSQAFMWTPNTGFVIIPTPPETIMSAASDIEGALIVGSMELDGDELGALGFIYNFETEEFINMSTLPGGTRSIAFAVNTTGQITGYWGNHVTGPWQAFIWEDGEMIDLGPSIGGVGNRTFDINEKGAITGWRREANGKEQIAFLWHNEQMTDLGPIPGGFTSEALGINIQNQITGAGLLPEPDGQGTLTRAFLWDKGQMINLGTLPGFPRSAGLHINDDKIVVGRVWGNGQSGIIWKDGVIIDLNDLISSDLDIHIETANAINNAGQITGTASGPFGIAAVLLTPIDSPLGDLDADCQITTADLLILLGEWGPCKGCPADLDGNGIVSTSDLLILLSNWG